MEYNKFIALINSGDIDTVYFYVSNYTHYNKCSIINNYVERNTGKTAKMIEVNLTDDKTEKISFYKKFNEKFKLFNFGRKGTFTLYQMWDKIVLTDIKYR